MSDIQNSSHSPAGDHDGPEVDGAQVSRGPLTVRGPSFQKSILAEVMTVVNGVLLDVLGRSPLIQIEQRSEQVVQAGVSALFLYPDIQQFVDLVFVGKELFAFDHIVVDAELTEESLVVVDVNFFKIVEAFPQRQFTCEQR